MPNPDEIARQDEVIRSGLTHYFTGAVIRMCSCPGPTQQVYSDGRKEYAHCDKCNRTWGLTGEEGKEL